MESSEGFDTVYPADTVEFCPVPGYTDLFICGTYKLLEDPKPHIPGLETPKAHRKGTCLVFRSEESLSYRLVQSLDFAAIPDAKWSHGTLLARPTLAVADSEGAITICQWNDAFMEVVGSTRCADVNTLCLSLDWNNRIGTPTNPLALASSLSNGEIAYLIMDECGDLRLMNKWHAHDYEPWITSWNYHDTNLLFSGGDDLSLKLWDIRAGFDAPVTINKRFEAGVTSVSCHLVDPTLVAVGSYDEKVRFFDTRNLLRPLSELQVGGGVWRLKWHPSSERQNDLLIACMHDGFKVGRYDREGGGSIVSEFRKHDSLAYGTDWSFSSNSEKTPIASCSFYDHKLHLWSA